MSDDRQEPPADDATRPLPRDTDPAGADATRPLPGSADRTPLDATARHEPLDATARHEPLDATARHEPVDATRPLPPGEPGRPGQPAGPVWSGRAGVPAPRPADYREPAEWYPEDPRGRRWWMPILLGILALLLVALIGTGVWLALRAARDDTPAPPPPLPTSAPVTSAAPTTTAPSTEPPSSPPTTTAAARVPVPPLTGLSRTTAQSLLTRLGLSYRVQNRVSDQPPGTVIETDPAAGELLAPGDEVTLVVAEAAESPSPSPSASSSSGGTGRPTPEPTPTR